MEKTRMRTDITKIKTAAIVLLAIATFWFGPIPARASEESDVRAIVQQVFQQLQSRDYGAVYDSLPSASRTRMSRDRFISALKPFTDFDYLKQAFTEGERWAVDPKRIELGRSR